MASRKPLRAVKDGEKSARKLSVSEAAESGDTLATLVSMRDRIARAVSDPSCPPRDLASLTRRLQDIVKDIDAKRAQERQEAQRRGDVGTSDGSFDASAI